MLLYCSTKVHINTTTTSATTTTITTTTSSSSSRPSIYYSSIVCDTGKYVHCARRGLDKYIVSITVPERAVLSLLSLGVALRTDESGASEAAETCIFSASI